MCSFILKNKELFRFGTSEELCRCIQLNIDLIVLHVILHTFAMLPFAYIRKPFY